MAKRLLKGDIFSLIILSLITDFQFLSISNWPLKRKVEFLFKKYLLLIMYIPGIRRFEIGKSFVNLFGRKVYLASASGLTPFQSIITYHQKMLRLINLGKNPTVIDVGANIGFFSLLIKDLFPLSSLYTIEPLPLIYNALLKNLCNYNNVHIFNLALSNKEGLAKMKIYAQDTQHSMLVNNNFNEGGKNLISITTEKLDSFIKKNKINTIDLLKIDVETFEKHVLRGAKHTLSKTRHLLIEITAENNYNYTFSQLVSLLYSNKFSFQLISFRNYNTGRNNQFKFGDFLFKNIKL